MLGGLIPAITACFSALASNDFVRELGLEEGFVKGETLTTLYVFAVSLAGFLSVTQANYWMPPRSFLKLISKTDPVRVQGLSELKDMFTAVERLDSTPADSPDYGKVSRLLTDMEWPRQVWVRENFSYLAETGFQEVPPLLEHDVTKYSQGHHCTLMLENLFNDARRAAKSSDRGRLESRGVWHATVTQPTVEFFFCIPLQ